METTMSTPRTKDLINEFIARIYSDLGKNVASIAFATCFFKDLPLLLRIVFGIFGIGSILYSVWLYKQGGK